MEKIDKDKWKKFKQEHTQKLKLEEYKLVCDLHSRYFNHKYYEPCLSCGGNIQKFKGWIADIDNIYD
jgi:rRNA maturation endonuclease Nob1